MPPARRRGREVERELSAVQDTLRRVHDDTLDVLQHAVTRAGIAIRVVTVLAQSSFTTPVDLLGAPMDVEGLSRALASGIAWTPSSICGIALPT